VELIADGTQEVCEMDRPFYGQPALAVYASKLISVSQQFPISGEDIGPVFCSAVACADVITDSQAKYRRGQAKLFILRKHLFTRHLRLLSIACIGSLPMWERAAAQTDEVWCRSQVASII
jgi:hypothetical protein